MCRNVAFCVLCVALVPRNALALDKQGSAHGGGVAGATEGFGFSGSLMLASAFFNPSYAARPDNTGIALFRYAAHADIDLIGRRLSIPVDLNFFTDRERTRGAGFLAPSEGDVITGVTSTWEALGGAVEGGLRFEHDRPLDRGGFSQTYVDARARYLFSAKEWFPKLGPALADGDVSGWATLGAFVINPTYAARPDNSGKALLRYALHTELSLFSDILSFGADVTMFTDARENAVGPSEADVTGEIIGHVGSVEAHIAYERDMPIDRGGLVQHFAYFLVGWSFDTAADVPGPIESRSPILSP